MGAPWGPPTPQGQCRGAEEPSPPSHVDPHVLPHCWPRCGAALPIQPLEETHLRALRSWRWGCLGGMGGGGGGTSGSGAARGVPEGIHDPPPNPLQLHIRGTPGLKSPNVGAELRMRVPHHPHAPPRTPTAPPWGSPPRPPPFILTLPLQGRPRLAAPASSSASLRSSVGTQRSFKRTSTSFGPPRVPAAPSPCPYGCCSGTRLGTARR